MTRKTYPEFDPENDIAIWAISQQFGIPLPTLYHQIGQLMLDLRRVQNPHMERGEDRVQTLDANCSCHHS